MSDKELEVRAEEWLDSFRDWPGRAVSEIAPQAYIAGALAERERLESKLKDMEAQMLAEHQAAVDMFGKYDELREENTKLREALQQIADGDVAQSSIKGYVDEAYQQIARKALGDKNV